MLDIDFGTYPFVTSSNPSIGGVASGLGLAPSKFQEIIGVVRPFPPPKKNDGSLAKRVCHFPKPVSRRAAFLGQAARSCICPVLCISVLVL